ncbi:acyltransferase [Peribacillus cavernae]|uniref:Acyltransferase n=1 Tax=Peribacillus cavernae TaxID=1674310 RepID=A0A433HRK6_9BACI|nr:acyltransferase [Peribacillus cavernae]MDQ0218776.1 fucose 4-O-acetylase-like acetyltransferase [Peribacillus cavernae]RUQ30987.1 acyltransferase [Peribacillus cavernae]
MERNYAIDFIKFFAIFAVVVIHTIPKDSLIGLFVLDNFSRFAVPFFFVASGYLFGLKIIDNKESLAYFKKYVIKILKIYVCWLVFYTIYDVLIIYKNGSGVQRELMKYFDEFTLLNLLYYGEGTSGYHLWFLTSLIWSIITLYVFFRIKKINILFIVSLVLNLIGLFGQSYSMFYKLPISSTRDTLFFGLFYTALGFFFAFNLKWNKPRQINNKTYLYLFFFFSLLQVMEGYILDKVFSGSHGEYFLSTIFLTAFLFFFALNNKLLGKGLLITKIGGDALGIYIVHVFFIDIVDLTLNSLGLNFISENLLWKLFETLIVFIISYIAYSFLQYLKHGLMRKNHS